MSYFLISSFQSVKKKNCKFLPSNFPSNTGIIQPKHNKQTKSKDRNARTAGGQNGGILCSAYLKRKDIEKNLTFVAFVAVLPGWTLFFE